MMMHRHNFNILSDFVSDFHSSPGPIAISGVPPELSDLHEMFTSAGQDLRYKTADCTGKENIGRPKVNVQVQTALEVCSSVEYTRNSHRIHSQLAASEL